MDNPASFSQPQEVTRSRLPALLTVPVLTAALALLACAESRAQASLYLTGIQTSATATYAYAEKITPLAGQTLGQGWTSRVSLNWLRYQYDVSQNDTDVKVRADAPGLEAGMGYAWQGEASSLNLSASAGYRYLNLEPMLPADKKTGGIFTLKPQVQAKWQMHPALDAELSANTSIGLRSSFTRTRFGWRANPAWRVGVESIWQSGDNYRLRQTGLFTAMPLSNGVGFELHAGRAEPRDGKTTTTYLGVGLSRMY